MTGQTLLKTVTIALTLCATARAAVDQSTPKAAVRAFVQAIVDGDEATIRQLVIDDADHRAAALALGRVDREVLRLDAACQQRFHVTINGETSDGYGKTRVNLRMPDVHTIDFAKVDLTDDHFAIIRLDDGKTSYRAQRVGDVWRIDMTDEELRTDADLRRFAGDGPTLQTAMADVATRLERGEFSSVAAARDACFSALMQASQTITTTRPTT